LLRVDPGSDLEESDGVVTAGGSLLSFADQPWPSKPALAGSSDVMVPLTPYHNWANRGPSTMRVWMPLLEEG
jgi:DUF1680 family protein